MSGCVLRGGVDVGSMDAVLQNHLPHAPWMTPQTWRLPGVQPLDPATWLLVDEAFEAQMARRAALMDERLEDVHALLPEARAAADECLETVLRFLGNRPDYAVRTASVLRPDGIETPIDRDAPLVTLGRLIQEDICLMLPGDAEHLLGGAILCFPASWTLREKIGYPLLRIHKTVPKYDENVGKRVQRLFDAIHVDRPMWRANAHLEDSPELFAPRAEDTPHAAKSAAPPYLRSERQTLLRLPENGAVVFAIHTWMVAVEDLTEAQAATLGTVFAQYEK